MKYTISTHIPAGIQKLQQHSRVLYLESPIYWKLKEALESLRLNPRFSRDRNPMNGVPGYFYGLVSALRMSYPNNDIFQDLHGRLASSDWWQISNFRKQRFTVPRER